MVEATQNPTQPQQQQASAVDEALKRNTDCVYFLASPLTCKKGAECEYRHSEYARVNPRDCYYWLNGNCLNPKCGFRHPPLDALLGTQAASGSSVPPSQTAATQITHVSYNSSKQGVACIFFQKGQCVKGDRCTFSHGPTHFGNKPSQPIAANAIPSNEPPPLKKTFGGLPKCTTEERRVPPSNVPKPVEPKLEVKLAPRVKNAHSRNVGRNIPIPTAINEEAPYYREPIVSSVGNGNNVSRSNCVHQIDASDDIGIQNVSDDEFLRESSPGFDVLVDNELRDSDYYQGEDQYGRTRGAEERNVDEYNISVGDADRGVFRDARGYDSYEQYDQMDGKYGWEQQHRASSDRVEKRGYPKSERQESDLRYRLSKQKGTSNGLRSAVSRDNRSEERNYQAPYRRDSQRHETSIAGRLRGRIKLPEREAQKRYSPGQPPIASHQGRLRDRIKGRVEENYNNEARNFGGPPRMLRREITDEQRTDFAPPKTLAELKAKNVESENSNNYSIRKRKSLNDPLPSSENEFPFKGLKPLSELLKRKRRSEPSAASIPSNEDNKNNKANSEMQEKADMQTSEQGAGTKTEQIMEEHELEGDDQREGEYEYEQGDEGEYEYEQGDEGEYYEEGTYEEGAYEEGNNEDGAEEYVEEEDLSKKIGVMLS